MKSKFFYIFCFLIFAFSLNASQNVKQCKSSQGINFLYMQDNVTPLVHIMISFKNCGSAYMSEDKSSLTRLYAEAVFCGVGDKTSTQLRQKLNNLSVSLVSDATEDDLCFYLTVPKMVLNEAVSLLNDVIKSPRFEEKEVKIIQNRLIGANQNYALAPRKFASDIFLPFYIFGSHPYRNGELGDCEKILKLTIKDLKDYRSKYIVINNARACIFGDVTENEASLCLDTIFSGVEKGEQTKDFVKDAEIILSPNVKNYHMIGPQSTISFALKAVKPGSADRYAMILLYNIIGASAFNSRIMTRLRKEEGLVYFGFINQVILSHAWYASGILQTDNTKVEKAITALREIIKNVREKGVTEEELEFFKDNIKGKFLVSLRTSRALGGFYFNKMRIGVDETPEEVVEKISKVTLKDVNKLASEILDEEKMSFIVIGEQNKTEENQ